MWKGSDKKVPAGTGSRMDKIDTLIASNVTITGDIVFSGGIQIDGTVNGNVVANEDSLGDEGKKNSSKSVATVRITKNGRVNGLIRGPNVIIDGTLDGDVVSTDHLELSSNGMVSGNVHYRLVEIMVGAQVNGSMAHIAQQSTSPVDANSLSTNKEPIAEQAAKDAKSGAKKLAPGETMDALETETL